MSIIVDSIINARFPDGTTKQVKDAITDAYLRGIQKGARDQRDEFNSALRSIGISMRDDDVDMELSHG